MAATRYRIVYRGEVGLGFEHDEIRENLVRLTRWDAGKIDQLLASSNCIIKNDLEADVAERMLNALNNTGIICRKEAIPAAGPQGDLPATAATIAVVGRAAVGDDEDPAKKCPKCGVLRDGGASCPACGIIFAKFGQARAAAASQPVVAPQVVSTHAAALQRTSRRRDDPLAKLEQGHPLAYYLGKLFFALAIALLLQTLFKADLTLLLLVLLPLGFVLYLGALSAAIERPFGELLSEHRSLLPIPFSDHEGHATLPLATYGLIVLHAVIYLAWQLRTPVEILQKSWFFPPLDSSATNLVLSALASLFFHPGGGAFLGGLFFLWIIGATLERRIGSGFLLSLYLFCGLLAAGIGFGVQHLFTGPFLPLLGAGGALAGLLGVYTICSHRRTMTFPLPFFGLDTFVLGAPYQMRWSSLLVAGLFVFADLGAPAEAANAGRGFLGLAILLGGFLSGLLGASVLGLGHKAGDEEEDEPVAGGQVFTANEATLRRRLAANPDNPDLLVQLARNIAEVKLTDEARQLYRRAIINRLASKPKEAAEIYREFNLRHQEVFEPKLTLRLASLYLRQGDKGMAAGVLSSVCDDVRATPQEREKALYQYGVTIARLGQLDEAYMMLKRFSDAFPDSPLLPKLREVVYDAAQPAPG